MSLFAQGNSARTRLSPWLLAALVALSPCRPVALSSARANPPVASYVFPAGGRRGTTVKVRVGGLFLYQTCGFELLGPGVEASKQLQRTRTVWFEGPILPLPDSQQAEDYPRDMAGEVRIAADAPLGGRRGRVWTAEGAASGLTFAVGDLPEVVEDEVDGDPIPVQVALPVTVNGRIFPREDVDLWSFAARKGQTVTAEVQAARLGSPLDSHLQALDARGRVLAENDDAAGADSRLRFTAAEDGTYTLRIRDVNSRGGQNYVYRLTITADAVLDSTYPLGGRRGTKVALSLSGQGVPAAPVEAALPANAPAAHAYRFGAAGKLSNPLVLDVDDLPEHLEAEPNDTPARARVVPLPAMVNGRIDRPGDVDHWGFAAKKGEAFAFELRAARLGSPLCGVLAVADAAGKVLATAEAPGPRADPALSFTAPADGTYWVRVGDRFRMRGGPQHAYRLRMGPPPSPDFRLFLATVAASRFASAADALTLRRGGQAKLKIAVERNGGFAGPITLAVEGLPPGVKAANATVAAKQPAAEITLTAAADAVVGGARLTVKGTATVGTAAATRIATLPPAPGVPETDSVLLGVALPVPFKVVGAYDFRLAPRGTVFRRRYKIERNGFDGPLEVSLADHQMRHLQGVTGPTLTVPPGVSEFEYPIQLPPWMETGRTSRACVMAVGMVEDGGKQHAVGYTSEAQNDQIIAVVETGLLGLEVEKGSVQAVPGQAVAVPVRVSRGKGQAGPVKLELVVPEHVRGLAAEPVVLPADRSRGTFTLRFAAGPPGPFNVPLVLRATLTTAAGPAIAETKIEVVADR
jgi:hypothetical protein